MNFSNVGLENIEPEFHDLRVSRFDLVDLSFNKIVSKENISGLYRWYSSIQASTLEDFAVLNISRNKIRNLFSEDFSGYQYLKVFDLSFNQIEFIDPRAFGYSNENLVSLNLVGNPIMTLGCPSDFRTISVILNLASQIAYPACVRVKILQVNRLTSSTLIKFVTSCEKNLAN